MTQKHTPTPWEIKPEEVDRAYIRIRGTQLGGRYKIANVLTPVYDGVDQREADETRANAQRIVRAVNAFDDLVGALEDILVCEKNRRADLATLSKKPGSIYDFSDKRVKRAEAALAKARGES